MYRSEEFSVIEELKAENLTLRKSLKQVKAENQYFKVQIRKLREDILKRDKELDALVDPRKSSEFRRLISNHGATMLVQLKTENEKFRRRLLEKDALIKRLQGDLKASNVYFRKTELKTPESCENYSQHDPDEFCFKEVNYNELKEVGSGRKIVKNDSLKNIVKVLGSDELEKLYYNLQKIKGNNKELNEERNETEPFLTLIRNVRNAKLQEPKNEVQQTQSENASPHLEEGCDTPHQEIQKLRNYFVEMLTEVEGLKETINHLQEEQAKTSSMLENKETNIEKLAAEIKTMKIGSSQANVGHKPNKSKRNRSVQKYPKNPKDSSSSRKRNKSISVQTLSQINLPHPSQSTPSKKIKTEPNLHSKLLMKRNFGTEATLDSTYSSLIKIENYDEYDEKKCENPELTASFNDE